MILISASRMCNRESYKIRALHSHDIYGRIIRSITNTAIYREQLRFATGEDTRTQKHQLGRNLNKRYRSWAHRQLQLEHNKDLPSPDTYFKVSIGSVLHSRLGVGSGVGLKQSLSLILLKSR